MSTKPPDKKPPEKEEHETEKKASREFLKDYLKKVYGVKMSGPISLEKELADSGQHQAIGLLADEFLYRLLARFNDIDVAPCDQFISMAEIEFAINTPRLHFDAKDNLMLQILKRYYTVLQDLAANEDPDARPHHGLTRQDLELIAESNSKECQALRKKLASEFTAKEPAS